MLPPILGYISASTALMCSIVATHYYDVCTNTIWHIGTEMQLDWYNLTLTKSVLFTLELATPDIYEWLCQWLISKLQFTPTQQIHAVTVRLGILPLLLPRRQIHVHSMGFIQACARLQLGSKSFAYYLQCNLRLRCYCAIRYIATTPATVS